MENVEVAFLYATYSAEKWFWIDSNRKMETKHPVYRGSVW